MERLLRTFERNKKWMLYILVVTFFWGLFAHAYCFFDNSFSHDSLVELRADFTSNYTKLTVGRVLTPVYRAVFRGNLTLPWFCGCLALLWTSAAVWLMTKILNIQSKVTAFFLAGIMTANITFAAIAATFMHDLDCYMFAMLCSTGATWMWQQGRPIFFWGGVTLLGISLGMYQGFLTVTIFLVILVSMLSLADGANWMRVFGKGLSAIAMIVLGIGLNQIIVQIGLKLTDVTMTEWNNNVGYLKNLSPWLLPQLLKNAYLGWYGSILSVASMYPNVLVSTLSKVLMAVFAFGIIAVLIDKKLGFLERLLFGVLAGLLPLGMNFFAMVAPEGNHDLTKYAIWLFYLVVLLFADRLGEKLAVFFPKAGNKVWGPKYISYAIILLILYSNANFANGMYLRKDYEYDAYFALMTKVSDRMEQLEDYIPGETPVVFVGVPLNDGTYMSSVLPGFERYTPVTGMWSSDVIMAEMPERFQAYFETILGMCIRCAQPTQWREILQDSRTEEIPCYPDQGCVTFVDDVLVVKLSEKYSTGVSFWRHPSVYSE